MLGLLQDAANGLLSVLRGLVVFLGRFIFEGGRLLFFLSPFVMLSIAGGVLYGWKWAAGLGAVGIVLMIIGAAQSPEAEQKYERRLTSIAAVALVIIADAALIGVLSANRRDVYEKLEAFGFPSGGYLSRERESRYEYELVMAWHRGDNAKMIQVLDLLGEGIAPLAAYEVSRLADDYAQFVHPDAPKSDDMVHLMLASIRVLQMAGEESHCWRVRDSFPSIKNPNVAPAARAFLRSVCAD